MALNIVKTSVKKEDFKVLITKYKRYTNDIYDKHAPEESAIQYI